jgi:hypothetical protein
LIGQSAKRLNGLIVAAMKKHQDATKSLQKLLGKEPMLTYGR